MQYFGGGALKKYSPYGPFLPAAFLEQKDTYNRRRGCNRNYLQGEFS